MMILCPWVAYLIAEGLELSGIVAILVNGILLNYYASPNISSSSKKVLKTAYETVAYSAETLVFIFLGIGLFAFNHPYQQTGVFLIIVTVLNINLARVLNLLTVTFLINKSRSKEH
jgi:sodium/hydrogen exchanger 8